MSGLIDGQHDPGPATEPPDPPVGSGGPPPGTDVGDVDTRLVDVAVRLDRRNVWRAGWLAVAVVALAALGSSSSTTAARSSSP